MFNRELTAPCGLYCGACAILYATRNNDERLKEKYAKSFGLSPNDLNCRGCLSDVVFSYCRVCPIKSCAQEKNIEGCHLCDEFPCGNVDNFPVPEGKAHILRAVPLRRQLGTEKWVEGEELLFSCPACGTLLFRGAKKCRKCGSLVV